jgi:hypothetical protein
MLWLAAFYYTHALFVMEISFFICLFDLHPLFQQHNHDPMIALTIHTSVEPSQVCCDIVALAWHSMCRNSYIFTYIVKV